MLLPVLLYAFLLTGINVTAQKPHSGIIRISGRHSGYFQTDKGQTYIPIGLNIGWPRFIDDADEGLQKMEFYFKTLSKNGGNFVRIWLSAPFWEVENLKAGSYSMIKAERLTQLIKLAHRYNIRIMFCLEHFRQLTGLPAPFAGSVPFDKMLYSSKNNGPLRDMDEFLLSSKGDELFMNRLRFLKNILGNSDRIFALELWNEMNAVQSQYWQEWTRRMLDSVKTVFKAHLVTQSLGSYDDTSYRLLHKDLAGCSGNDIIQVHRYLDLGAKWNVCSAAIEELSAQACQEMIQFNIPKPVLLSEAGAVEPKHAGPSRLYIKDRQGIMLHDILYTPFFCGAAGPGQVWHWDSYVEKNNLWWHFNSFYKAIEGFDPVLEKASPFSGELGDSVRYYGLRGKKKTLIWVKDLKSNWLEELENEKLPRWVTNVKMRAGLKAKRLRFYNPWTQKWVNAGVNKSVIELPTFKRSLVISFEN
jgi:hypothetical protein